MTKANEDLNFLKLEQQACCLFFPSIHEAETESDIKDPT